MGQFDSLSPHMTAPVLASARQAGSRWVLLALLVLSICINYIDRGNLSVAAHELSGELNIKPGQMGLLLSAFFWTYASFQIVSGWAIDRFPVLWVYGAAYFVWSAATALTGWATGFTILFALRLLLGIAESVAYPSYSKIIASGFAENQRGTANSLIDAGSKSGPALGLLIGGTIVAQWGWRAMFLWIGGASLLWLIPWCVFAARQPIETHAVRRRSVGPSLVRILAEPSAWGSFLGLFCFNYTWYFLLTWLPTYLRQERHYTLEMMAIFGSLPFWATAASSMTGGYLSDLWISKGGSPTQVRKTLVSGGLAGTTLLLFPVVVVSDPRISMVMLICACVTMGMCSSNIWAITQTLAGKEAAGKWTGLQNTAGNLAGIAAPILTGRVVELTGQFFWAFVVACFVVFVGAASFLWIVGAVAPVRWESTEDA